LTPRERDVLGGVARGLSNRAIADELGIAERTARTHVSNILAKLGLTSRTQAALFAVEHHLDRAP
jgi:DNA-binding NarL/FixJ family response regulator